MCVCLLLPPAAYPTNRTDGYRLKPQHSRDPVPPRCLRRGPAARRTIPPPRLAPRRGCRRLAPGPRTSPGRWAWWPGRASPALSRRLRVQATPSVVPRPTVPSGTLLPAERGRRLWGCRWCCLRGSLCLPGCTDGSEADHVTHWPFSWCRHDAVARGVVRAGQCASQCALFPGFGACKPLIFHGVPSSKLPKCALGGYTYVSEVSKLYREV
jgi:hypothetical protein